MKKLLIAAAIAATTFAPQAFAQAKNFEGFSLGVNVNATSSDSDLRNSAGFVKMTGQTSANGSLQAQYNLPLSDSFVLGFGGTYEFGDIDLGSIGSSFSGKRKDAYSVYVAPGFAVAENWLVYGKVASINAKFESTGLAVFAGSTTASGVGYGLGVQTLLGKNVYLQAEYMQNKYDDQTVRTTLTTQVKAEARTFSFGIGYKF
jgi:outer membrane immunogenic protein